MFTFKIQKMTNFDHNNPKLIHFYLKIQNFDKFLTNCDLKNPKLIHFDLKNPKFWLQIDFLSYNWLIFDKVWPGKQNFDLKNPKFWQKIDFLSNNWLILT